MPVIRKQLFWYLFYSTMHFVIQVLRSHTHLIDKFIHSVMSLVNKPGGISAWWEMHVN